MIIDVHGHYTTAPSGLQRFRDAQLARLADPSRSTPGPPDITDAEIVDTIEAGQLRVLDERGIDLMLISPKASGMAHDVPDEATAVAWAQASNDLIHRVVQLFPRRFAGVAQLPQTPTDPTSTVLTELRRSVEQLGFVACNVNPDPSGTWAGSPVTDPSWLPLWELIEELDIPAMIHVSSACNPNHHTLGAHYLNADTSVFMQLLQSDLFDRFPGLRLVIPHGGGAVPYHWGRYRGLAIRLGRPDPERLLRNVFFDTCVYHQPGIDLLTRVIPTDNLLFASEMLGAVRGADPETGIAWDDTRRYVGAAPLTDAQRTAVLAENALRVYPRLRSHLDNRSS